MLKRDQEGQLWIVSDLKIDTDKTPLKGKYTIYVGDVFCGDYEDKIGQGGIQIVKCYKPVKGNSVRI